MDMRAAYSRHSNERNRGEDIGHSISTCTLRSNQSISRNHELGHHKPSAMRY